MRVDAPAPIRRPLPLVPLVDVVFLLLMFFMLSSTFSKFSRVELNTASSRFQSPNVSSDAGEARKASIPGVIISISGGPRIKINGIEATLDNLAARLDEYHDKGVTAGAAVLTSSAEVQDLVTVLERARNSKLTAITVMR
jgi:biopolymer transport protein ExbD